MNPADLKSLIKECLAEVLAEEKTIRACSYCDMITGAPDSLNRSHGYCKEHAVKALKQDWGVAEDKAKKMIEDMFAENPDAFPPNTSGAKETDPLPKRAPTQAPPVPQVP
jgi:hypothetical protein